MIHRFRVQNFKSILDVSVVLSPVTVLVGKSGTGKSNFIRALRSLRDVLVGEQPQLQALHQTWPQLRSAMLPNAPTSFDIEFSIAGIEERFRYELSIRPEGPTMPPVKELLNLGDKCLFHQAVVNPQVPHQLKWIVEPELSPLPAAGPIALGRIPSISEIVIAFTALTSGIGCYAFSDSVLCGINQYHAATGLNDGATNFLATLKDIVSNLQDLKVRRSMIGALQRVNSSIASVELDDIRQPKNVLVGHKFNGKTLPLLLSQESDGFRRFYAHLLALYQRPAKQTLTFEHPEDGIHPGALSLLADEFQATYESGRGQIILTTHSPKLLDHFDAEQIRVVDLDGLATRIGFISDEQKEALHDNLLDAGELLTTDPARIQREAAIP